MKIDVKDDFFDDKSVVEDCILDIKRRYNIKTMIDNDCIDYSFINIIVAQKICDALDIASLALNKFKRVKEYDDRRDKNITHVIYSFLTIRNHIESSTSMLIIELDQHSIILEKS